MELRNVPRKIIVHHTADASRGPQLGKVNQDHRKKWEFRSSLGSYVGYHYFIEKDGAVWQTRDEREEGAHTRGHNLDSIGICLAGDFDLESPTGNQKLSLVKVVDRLAKIYQIPPYEIHPHRLFAATSCYGLRLSDSWAREEYRSYLIADLSHLLTILKALLEKLYEHIKRH